MNKNAQRTTKPFLVKQDDLQAEPEVTSDWNHHHHITPGTYPAYVRKSKVYRDPMFQRWSCLIVFDVLETDSPTSTVIAELAWFLNLGKSDKPHAGRRGKYWRAWILANNGRGPRRSDRMAPIIFRNRYCTVLVRDVARDFHGIASSLVYSVVETVVEWKTGGQL